jgi:undecaprenyl-diphosphatase
LSASARKDPDYKYGWAIIIGSVPIAIVGFVFRHTIETTFRSLWWVAGALIAWSVVLWLADRFASQTRTEKERKKYGLRSARKREQFSKR